MPDTTPDPRPVPMPDRGGNAGVPDHKPQTTLQQVRDVLLALAAVITAISAPISIIMGYMHAEDVKANSNANAAAVQTQVDDKAGQVLSNQAATAKTAVEVKRALESPPPPDKIKAQELNLYSNWKQLEWIANDDPTTANVNAANEAKKLYIDDYKKNHGGKQP